MCSNTCLMNAAQFKPEMQSPLQQRYQVETDKANNMPNTSEKKGTHSGS